MKISKILPVEPKRYLEIMDISLGKSYTMYIYGPELEVYLWGAHWDTCLICMPPAVTLLT